MSDFERQIAWSASTDKGPYRAHNEDNFIALKVNGEGVFRLGTRGEDCLAESDFVFAVSDGMGGAKSGDFASQVVVEQIALLFPKVFKSQAQGLVVYFQDVLMELVSNVHVALNEMGQAYSELEGMGATLSLCWLRTDRMYFVHVGDSRIYHLSSSGDFEQLTRDHTHVGWLKERGELSDYEARNDPRRNILQQVIGGKSQHLNPQFGELVLDAHDRVLLCSDGLYEGLMDSALKRMLDFETPLRTVESTSLSAAMVEAAILEDGKDNTTALCVDIAGGLCEGESS